MTEKRYSLVYYADKGGAFIRDNKNSIEWYHDSRASLLEIVDKLNELAEKNNELKKQREELFIRERNTKNKLRELQERNNRQAKQLDNLYTLIEKQDWKNLTGLIQEFQECEEQLQKEWSEIE